MVPYAYKGLFMKRSCLYSGSFDPMTLGHWNIVCAAIAQYKKVYIGIGTNPSKKGLFLTDERIEIIKNNISDFINSFKYKDLNKKDFSDFEITAYERLVNNPNIIEIVPYNGLTIDIAIKLGVVDIVHGERNSADSEYEKTIETINKNLLTVRNKNINFVNLTPINQLNFNHISSSNTKYLCSVGEFVAVENYVSHYTHNILMAKYLYDIFKQSSVFFGITDEEKIKSEYNNIVKSYSTDRTYHNLSHVAACINYLNIYNNISDKSLSSKDFNNLVMAIYFHDIVQGNNAENLSKEIMIKYLNYGAKRIASLIDATKHSDSLKASNSFTKKLMSDLDLSILGDKSRYNTYSQKVRQEYTQYQDNVFAKGRLGVLDKLSAKKTLFETKFFKDMFENTANKNMALEKTFWQEQLKIK